MGYLTDLDFQPPQPMASFKAEISTDLGRNEHTGASAPARSNAPSLSRSHAPSNLSAMALANPSIHQSTNPIHGPSTPIVPVAIAIAVWEEASELLDTALPRSWIRQLTRRADAVCLHNPEFRARVYAAAGNAGRDYLWTFMRHWISGLLFQHDPSLAAQLPAGYNVGHVRRS